MNLVGEFVGLRVTKNFQIKKKENNDRRPVKFGIFSLLSNVDKNFL